MAKYPIGIQTFETIREEGYLYIDKTQYVYDLANNYKYVFLSRPRRFGKSLLTSTFNSYFSGRKDLFEGLAAYDLEKDWVEYPVLQFDLSLAKKGTIEELDAVLDSQLSVYEQQYDCQKTTNQSGIRLIELTHGIFAKTQKHVVVLIDGYDTPMLPTMKDEAKFDEIRTALMSFMIPLKNLDPYLRFAFITGITKFPQVSIFSQLNNLTKISMKDRFAEICGITQTELEANFQEGIANLEKANDMTHEEAIAGIKSTYDGYRFSESGENVYNPYSILACMKDWKLSHYWHTLGTPSFLLDQIRKFNADISKYDNFTCIADEFDTPTEYMFSIIPLLYQCGYLTIKSYEKRSRRYTLGYPNEEVKTDIDRMIKLNHVSPNNNATITDWKVVE